MDRSPCDPGLRCPGVGLAEELAALGYKTDLRYAASDPEVQQSQVVEMLAAGAQLLIVRTEEAEDIDGALQQAKDAGIVIIAYEGLPLFTQNVDYFVHQYDQNQAAGKLMGEYLRDALELDSPGARHTFEWLAQTRHSTGAEDFFSGAWEILGPYLERGALVCLSGRCPATVNDLEEETVPGWQYTPVEDEMADRLA
ncbi:MAG: substrate-binding domain-containing protein, partial [Micrococcales bacterium]|nr:substrate-binding domain-containing protein [Micrococcales bacterium]